VTPTVDGRRVRLTNVFNLRDLGGHPTRDGREVRTGLVFRADGLNRLDGDDIEVVRPLGLRTVIDLRTEMERTDHGVAPHDELGATIVHLPVIDVLWPSEGADQTHPVDYLVARYLEMTEGVGATSLAGVVRLLAHAEPEALPAVFHCSAGKDRTGVTAAVLLSLLDVPEDEIAIDYHHTADAMTDLVAWIRDKYGDGTDPMADQPGVFLACPPEAMIGFLDEMRRRHGTVVDYVRSIGVQEDEIASLRDRLLT
jgi:protein-tyrosine phosphatase